MDISKYKNKGKMLGVVNLKYVIVYFLILIFSISIVYAGMEDFTEAKKLIDAKTQCSQLSERQLEIIGEYYMEQMHPGESHELMHQMMGLKEGSEDEEQFHINMAKAVYCGETNAFGPAGMMGGGMINMMIGGNMMNYGMMGNYGYGFGYWNFINILYVILLIGLIILIYLWILKLWKNMQNKSGKK